MVSVKLCICFVIYMPIRYKCSNAKWYPDPKPFFVLLFMDVSLVCFLLLLSAFLHSVFVLLLCFLVMLMFLLWACCLCLFTSPYLPQVHVVWNICANHPLTWAVTSMAAHLQLCWLMLGDSCRAWPPQCLFWISPCPRFRC